MAWSDEVTFETGSVEDDTLGAGTLANGNFVLAWEETDSTDDGKFAVYGTDRTEVVAPTQFHAPATAYVALTTLSNGNFFIIYSDDADGDKGKFVIYNSAGSLIKAETQFEAGDCAYIACCTFSDDSVFCAYRQANANFYYVIFNSAGTITVGPTQIAGVDPNYTKAVTLANDNAMIMFRDSDDSGKLKALVRDSSGAQIVATTELSALSCLHLAMCLLPDNNIAISYRTTSNAYMQVIQPDTTSVKAETIIEALAFRPKVSPISTGGFFYIYGDNSNTLQYKIFDNDGTENTGKTAVGTLTLSVHGQAASTTVNLIVYQDGAGNGEFRTFGVAGPGITTPTDTFVIKRLVAIGNSKVYYEDV